jgi:hypothetical protein
MIYDWKKLVDDFEKNEHIPFKNTQYLFPIVADYSDIPIIEFNHYSNLIFHGQIIKLDYEEEYFNNNSASQDLH